MNYLLIVSVISLSFTSACGGGPKKVWERAFGTKKDDETFAADVSQLKGPYVLNSVKSWNSSGSVSTGVSWQSDTRGIDPNVVFYVHNGSIEIASLTDSPIKSCGVTQPISQGPGNHLEIAAAGACEAQSFEIINQDSSRFTLLVPPFPCTGEGKMTCNGLEFESTSDPLVGEKLYEWPQEVGQRLPPKIKSLMYVEVESSTLSAIRTNFKAALTSATVILSQDLSLEHDNFASIVAGFPYSKPMTGGKVVSWDDQFVDSTICSFLSKKTNSIQSFRRKIAKTEVYHTNRKEGLWTYDQLHEGLDTILTPEQRRIPSENKLPSSEIDNSVTITIEAADSEKNGNGAKIDHDVQLSCSKSRRKGPITIEDVKSALGDIIRFEK